LCEILQSAHSRLCWRTKTLNIDIWQFTFPEEASQNKRLRQHLKVRDREALKSGGGIMANLWVLVRAGILL